MNNGNNAVQGKHLESVTAATKRYILAQILDVTDAVSSELENFSGATVLDTVAATVDGGLWFELDNSEPVIKFHYGSNDYSLTPTIIQELDPQLSIGHESGSEDITNGWIAYNNRYRVNYLGNGTITVSDGGKNVCHYNSSTRIITLDPYGGEITMTVSLSAAPPYVAASVSYTFLLQGSDEPS
ncbi:MAG: hypothetical protein IJG80_09270 [Selenomonadaceae bacterium]|nr:hypothetical protein [Selenomonadaceae bacterium]MBQ3433690.1 hypothetical protein [Selenomonadaceae bacterium]